MLSSCVPVRLVDAAVRAGQHTCGGGAPITVSHAVARQCEHQEGLCTLYVICKALERKKNIKENDTLKHRGEKYERNSEGSFAVFVLNY